MYYKVRMVLSSLRRSGGVCTGVPPNRGFPVIPYVGLGETPFPAMLAWYHQGFFTTCGGFLKWWYPTTMGFPTKNDHFLVFWGYHHLRKHPCIMGCL